MPKEITVDGWRVYDLPQPYTQDDYNEARSALVGQASHTPELLALFEYGYIPLPGISDMDFWAVYADDAPIMRLVQYPVLTPKMRDVMKDQVLFISRKHYRKYLYFDPWTTNVWPEGHRLLYQKEGAPDCAFEMRQFTPEEYAVASMAYVDELLASVFAHIPLYAKKELPVRSIFESIKNCVYILREVRRLTGQDVETDFAESFPALRERWFSMTAEQGARELIPLFAEALRVAFICSFAFAEWSKKHVIPKDAEALGLVACGTAGDICVATFGEERVYTDSVATAGEAFERSVASYRRMRINVGLRSREIDRHVTYLPRNAASMYLALCSSQGILSKALRKNTYARGDVPVFFHPLFDKKALMINEITEIYDKKRGPGGKGWLFANNRFQYEFSREKLRRTALAWLLRRAFWRSV